MYKSLTRMRPKNRFLAGLLVLVIGVGTGSMANAAAYIKFEGVEGEALDKDHKGWSDILAIGHSMRFLQDVTDPTRRRGETIHDDFTFVKELDKASPKLAEALLKSTVFPKATIELQAQFNNPFVWKRFTFENVIITSGLTEYQGTDVKETYTFSYDKIQWRYIPILPDGKPSVPVEFGWDVIAQQPIGSSTGDATPTPVIPGPPDQPTPTPVIPGPPDQPTPTPVIPGPPEQPTPTPILPGPPTGEEIADLIIQGDVFTLNESEFKQHAVIVPGIRLPGDIPDEQMEPVDQDHFLVSLPNGVVITNVLKKELRKVESSKDDGDHVVLIAIDPEGKIHPFAEMNVPALSLKQENLIHNEARLVNMAFNGKDQLNLLLMIRAMHPTDFRLFEAVAVVTIEGPFKSTPVSNFSVY